MPPETSPRPSSVLRPEAAERSATSFHVALDPALARRAPAAAGEVLINGFLLLDCGGYELCTARLDLAAFWQMKAMDMFGAARQAAGRERNAPPAGSVWQVEGRLSDCVAGSLRAWNREGGPEGFERDGPDEADGGDRVHHLRVEAVTALDRVWIGARGPELFEAYESAALAPGAR